MKEYELNIDPGILELLGPNLYTNIYYVLAELIANAYDADAKNVYILSSEDNIRVEDDGHGMSYESGDIKKYLSVAVVSRHTEDDSYTKSGTRLKMGRKGVGKLAALSVSENVDILTVSDGEKSGFVLSRRPNQDKKLDAIDDNDIKFIYVKDHGSAIVMRKPQYRLHKTLNVIKRNLLKIFPQINKDFRIHIIIGEDIVVIDEFDMDIMKELSTLITLGDTFSELCDLVPDYFPSRRSKLVIKREVKEISVRMKNNSDTERTYTLSIRGWIGTYKSTRGRKVYMTDFPDNFISIFANNKMGEFNILPLVGQNKLNEVFVVGQIHVDLFELSELPDMALSNRQGYKTDDLRYKALLDYVRNELLRDILKCRGIFIDLGKEKKKLQLENLLKEKELSLKESVDKFRKKASSEAAQQITERGSEMTFNEIESIISQSININSPDLGLKAIIDSQKKKILISQTVADKDLSDVIYQMLLYNNVPCEDILYTNCENEVCRVPVGRHVYDYLKEFFVESYSAQKIYVIFVTSDKAGSSWGAVIEVGASWITKIDHTIFNIYPFRPSILWMLKLNGKPQIEINTRLGNCG